MSDRSPTPLDALLADLLDERFEKMLTAYAEFPTRDDIEAFAPSLREELERGGTSHAVGSQAEPGNVVKSVQRLGRFEIVRELGRGGGGIVFLAFDPQLKRNVALKVPHPEVLVHRELRSRFIGEAQAAAALKHPNIVLVYEAGEIGPICYIASEYCEGPALDEWLKQAGRVGLEDSAHTTAVEGRATVVDIRAAAELVATLADAVEHAHQHGILHRDLKPSNVLLVQRGGASEVVGYQAEPGNHKRLGRSLALPAAGTNKNIALVPKLTDFGLAKVLEREKDLTHTRSTAMVGTPAYMSPEQVEGRNAEIGPATDVYALGVILYELLTGQTPFKSDSNFKMLQAIASPEPPIAPRRIRRDLPRDLEAICLKCLEKGADRRYESAAALADDLRRFLDWRPTVARPDAAATRAWKWARRRPAWAALAVILALTPIALGAGVLFHDRRVERVESTASATIQARDAAERDRIRRHDYASHIQGAYQAWQNADLTSAMALLDRCRPVQGQDDLRGWEWYYVRRLCAGGILTLCGHEGPVRGVAFSPNGERLASCDAEGVLRIWDALNGRSLATMKLHAGGANAVAYSRDGRLLATVGDDGYVRLWNPETYELDSELVASDERTEGPFYKLLSVALSRDGKYLAAAGEDRVIRVWNTATREIAATLTGHTDTIHSIAFSPTENVLASGSADRTARLWNLSSADEPSTSLKCSSPVAAVAFSPDGQSLVTADPQIHLWNVASRTQRAWLALDQSPIHSLAYSADGNTIACAALDSTVTTWNVAPVTVEPHQEPVTGMSLLQRRHTYRGHTRAALCVAFSVQGKRLASGGKDGTIQIWDPDKPQDRYPLGDAGNSVECVTFSPDGDTLAVSSSAGASSQVTLWNLLARERSSSFTLPESSHAGSIVYSSDGKQIALSISKQPFLVRDMVQGVNRQFAELRSIGACAFSRDSRMLAVVLGGDNSTRILDASTGNVLAAVPGQRSIAFSPDGRLLATESSQTDQFYRVELWNVWDGRTVARLAGHTGEIDSIAFSAECKYLATGSTDGTARLWSVEEHSERWVLRGHQGAITKVAFLLNDRSLASASADGTVKIWDVDTGRQLLSLDVAEGLVSTMAASHDGRTLATVSKKADGTRQVELWDAPLERRTARAFLEGGAGPSRGRRQ